MTEPTVLDVSPLRDRARGLTREELLNEAATLLSKTSAILSAHSIRLLSPMLESGALTTDDLIRKVGEGALTFSDPVSLGERTDIQVSFDGEIVGWLVMTMRAADATVTLQSISATPPVEG